jgi:hypothetical protein
MGGVRCFFPKTHVLLSPQAKSAEILTSRLHILLNSKLTCMENPNSAQQLFFQHIKDILPPHLSLVDEVAELLDISNDSAYRRIRSEKAISFEELRTLCGHFKISLDQLLHLKTDTLLFEGKFIDRTNFDFDGYLQDLLQLLTYASSFERKEILFLGKDAPIFHHFNFPELAAFKSFFWMKTILNYPEYNRKRFVSDEFSPATGQLCKKLIEAYNKVPSQEVWHIECIQTTIRQVEYYRDTKVFASDNDVETIYACLVKTIDHIEAQVEQGVKFPMHAPQTVRGAPYKFYINEFIFGDNTYLVHLNDGGMVVLNHAVLNTIRTRDVNFVRSTDEHVQNIIRRSTQISQVGEKERSKFFNILREKIEDSRKRN